MYPASTTKILTALLALEKCNPTDKVVVSKNAITSLPAGSSSANLQVGEELTVSDLLYALLIPSANEAAIVLAEHISGSVEEFANLCNNRAKELGCETLHFVNPNGLHDENHYCSAYDLYLIAKECKKYELFEEIVKTKSFTLPATTAYPQNNRTFKNTNELLQAGKYFYSYCTGIKTGHTTPAGECLVASSTYDNMDLISVVLGGKINSKGLNERFYDTKQLFEFTYNNYGLRKIAKQGQTVQTINVKKATKDTATLDVVVDTDISAVIPIEINEEDIKTTISIDENIVAPIEQNQVLGQVTYSADGLNYTTNIIASHAVQKIPYYIYNIIVAVASVVMIFVIIRIISKKHRKNKNWR